MMNARECLLRAGFHQDERYEAVLFDPERRIAIRLLERNALTTKPKCDRNQNFTSTGKSCLLLSRKTTSGSWPDILIW